MFKSKYKPWPHQQEAFDFLFSRKSGALFMEMGTGKTKVMIDVILNSGFDVTLVACPYTVCAVWEDELLEHAARPYVFLDLTTAEGDKAKIELVERVRKDPTRDVPLIVACNYESVWLNTFKKYWINHPPTACVCDESHRIKSAGSSVSMFFRTLGRRVEYRYCLTGTPLTVSPLDFYGQYRFLDTSIFGESLDRFEQKYALLDNSHGYKKITGWQNLDELYDKAYSAAFRVDNSVLSLPPVLPDVTLKFDLSPRARKAYEDLKRKGILKLPEGVLKIQALIALGGRLQQITSGYAPVYDDNKNETHVEVDTGRVRVLRELLEGIPAKEPVVVFAKYKQDLRNIKQVAANLKRKYYEISGASSDYRSFKQDPQGVVAVQIHSGGAGISLVEAQYCVYYSITNYGDYAQSRARVHRPGQKRAVSYYFIAARNTVDVDIIRAMRGTGELIDAFLSGEFKNN